MARCFDGSAAGSLEEIRELSGGEGAAAVLDFVGIDATMRLGLASLARRGLFVLVGLAGGTAPVGFFSQASEVAFTTSVWGSRNDLAEVIALAQQGKLTAATETHRLDDINQVLERLEHGLVDELLPTHLSHAPIGCRDIAPRLFPPTRPATDSARPVLRSGHSDGSDIRRCH